MEGGDGRGQGGGIDTKSLTFKTGGSGETLSSNGMNRIVKRRRAPKGTQLKGCLTFLWGRRKRMVRLSLGEARGEGSLYRETDTHNTVVAAEKNNVMHQKAKREIKNRLSTSEKNT